MLLVRQIFTRPSNACTRPSNVIRDANLYEQVGYCMYVLYCIFFVGLLLSVYSIVIACTFTMSHDEEQTKIKIDSINT